MERLQLDRLEHEEGVKKRTDTWNRFMEEFEKHPLAKSNCQAQYESVDAEQTEKKNSKEKTNETSQEQWKEND